MTARRLSAATYNIHKCVGHDRRHRPERTFAVLRELDADVIGIQEFDSRPRRGRGAISVADFEAATGYRALEQPTMHRDGGFHGNLLLTRLPILREERIALEFTGFEPRGAIVADLEVAGQAVRVAVTHLGLWPGVRRRQAQLLVERLQALDGAPLVLLGDLNEWLPLAGCNGILRARFGHSPSAPTWPARRPLVAYDRILVAPGACQLETRVHGTELARATSDHLPVRAEIAWTSEHFTAR